jgi:hypothetical protein
VAHLLRTDLGINVQLLQEATVGSALVCDEGRLEYFPFFRRKGKRSTAMTNEDRIGHHLIPELQDRALGSFGRDDLQGLLDRNGAEGFSFSTVDHLRWDLKQAFEMAVPETASAPG